MLLLDFGINMRQKTGVVVALHGKETDAGEFSVLDILEAGLPPQLEKPLNKPSIACMCIFLLV